MVREGCWGGCIYGLALKDGSQWPTRVAASWPTRALHRFSHLYFFFSNFIFLWPTRALLIFSFFLLKFSHHIFFSFGSWATRAPHILSHCLLLILYFFKFLRPTGALHIFSFLFLKFYFICSIYFCFWL